MRLFTGIDLTEDVRSHLESLLDRLRPAAPLRWSAVPNLHVTTKFIGEWPEARLAELTAALAALPRPGAITITIRELGWFPNWRAPRVFWAGIHGDERLYELARATEICTRRLGVPPEKRPYSPHLTLARVHPGAPLSALRLAIAGLPSAEFGSFTADRFHLYLSQLTPAGSRYTKLVDFSLG